MMIKAVSGLYERERNKSNDLSFLFCQDEQQRLEFIASYSNE
jgi:hypothetical protein